MWVLILVVVDDSLVLQTQGTMKKINQVLILVVVDDSLVLKVTGKYNNKTGVLILVVVDDSLVRVSLLRSPHQTTSLNPCCSGR